jgi:Tol biopolymer transport system component
MELQSFVYRFFWLCATMALMQACGKLVKPHGQLAFESERDGNSEIYLIDVDGENLQNLTNNEAYDGTPAFSPDGKQIAFTSDRGLQPEVYLMDVNGSNPTQITSAQGYSVVPAFSPDGQFILFSSNRSYRLAVDDGEIEIPDQTKLWSINLESGELARHTTSIGLDMYGSFSPDGEEAVFMSVRDGNPEIYHLTADGKEINLTNNPALDMVPDWSPDDTKVVFMSDREGGNKEIYILDLERGGEPVNLTNHPANDSDPKWSPDGAFIAFTSDRDGNAEIYIMRADGSDVRRVTDHPANDTHPVWNPSK